MSEKQYGMPAVVWLKVTDYMHGWLQYELGGAMRIKGQRVVCPFDLPGVKETMRMETADDMMDQRPVGLSMSDTWKNCIEAGLEIDPESMEKTYGITKSTMDLFVPVECPKRRMTRNGVLRPWTLEVNLGRQQANALQRLIREEFWKAVGRFNEEYARKMGGRKYPAVDMIEAFCAETKTPDLYVAAMRREWQRRVKREGNPHETR